MKKKIHPNGCIFFFYRRLSLFINIYYFYR
nr:MAG TPA: Ribosome, CHIMERIC HYBRID STATE RIBOSOME [Caudoviricetes sp.]